MGHTEKKLRETGKNGPACSGENISFHIMPICETSLTLCRKIKRRAMSGAEEVGEVFTALDKTTYRGEIFVLGIRVEL